MTNNIAQVAQSEQFAETSDVKSILDMADGAIKERIAYEIPKVIANIADPNTDATKARTITLKLKFIPSEDRGLIAIKATVEPKLQPTDPVSINLVLSRDINGLSAFELPKKTPGQIDLYGVEAPQPQVLEMIRGE